MTILQVTNLTCEYRTNPLGIDLNQPRLSWRIESDRRGTLQHSYKIQVSLTEGFENPLWDTGVIESDQSLHIEYDGPSLVSRTRYYYRIKVWDNFGRESNWCDISWWETALLDSSEWKASWITPNPEEIHPQAEPTFMLRKQFELKSKLNQRVFMLLVSVFTNYI